MRALCTNGNAVSQEITVKNLFTANLFLITQFKFLLRMKFRNLLFTFIEFVTKFVN